MRTKKPSAHLEIAAALLLAGCSKTELMQWEETPFVGDFARMAAAVQPDGPADPQDTKPEKGPEKGPEKSKVSSPEKTGEASADRNLADRVVQPRSPPIVTEELATKTAELGARNQGLRERLAAFEDVAAERDDLARISQTHLGGVSSGADEPGCGSICVALRQSGPGLIV